MYTQPNQPKTSAPMAGHHTVGFLTVLQQLRPLLEPQPLGPQAGAGPRARLAQVNPSRDVHAVMGIHLVLDACVLPPVNVRARVCVWGGVVGLCLEHV